MSYLIKPKNYNPLLDLKQTELGIKQIKEFFQLNLSSELRLRRVTAPLFVLKGMGINDDLNGIERPVSFPIKDLGDAQAEVVHSLAKWKRLTLADYHIEPGYGIYTDMNAIRSDEELGNLHSLYVDQWDWERVITNEDRNVNFLKEIVNRIYAAMIRTEYMVYEMYPQIKPCLPQKLHFIHSEELRQLYPDLEPKCREHAICQKYGAVFIIGIGCKLSDGKKHDGRAPDYDDYTTKGLNDLPGLNGDLLLWDNVLQRSIELSSMGIRVDKEALQRQLKEEKEEKRLELYFHKRLMNDTLPLSIGGGIGQSRLCMFYLRKAHIGEIQASIWPEDMRKECEELDIHLIYQTMNVQIEESWKAHLKPEFDKDYFRTLTDFVKSEYSQYQIFPPGKLIFNAFNLCPFDKVKVVIIGQDPYHGPGQAHGLCFSVNDGVPFPPSLVNIFKEIKADIGSDAPATGNLTRWAEQGVLLLNATLTVRAHQAGSHQNRGWETFTDAAIRALAEEKENLVFILWGSYAQKKGAFIDRNKHLVLTSAHPSPLSAYNGFFGNKHFSRTNDYLKTHGKTEIAW